MIKLLSKLFIKDYKNTKNPKVRKAYGMMSSIFGIIVNILLALSKILFGLLSFSISITADGLNNLSDAGSSIISLIGFKVADKPADKEHPFGHARVEYISGMIISFVILFLGLQLVMSSVEGIITPQQTTFSYLLVVILGVSILTKLYLMLFNRKLAKMINSTTLKATSIDSLSDVISTSAVLISLFISKFSGVNLDAYMGVAVSIFIIVQGIRLLKETLSPLLGEKPATALVNTIYTKVLSYEHVLGIHDLVVHNYGPQRNFASVHVEVDSKRDIMDSHEMIDKIEREFLEDGIHLVIHLDPIVTDDEHTNELRELAKAKLSEIDSRLSMHDFRLVWGKTRKNLIFDVVIPQDFKLSDRELLDLIQEKVHAADGTLYTVVSIDRNYIM